MAEAAKNLFVFGSDAMECTRRRSAVVIGLGTVPPRRQLRTVPGGVSIMSWFLIVNEPLSHLFAPKREA